MTEQSEQINKAKADAEIKILKDNKIADEKAKKELSKQKQVKVTYIGQFMAIATEYGKFVKDKETKVAESIAEILKIKNPTEFKFN